MSATTSAPSFLDVMKSPEFTGPEVLDQRAFHIRTVIKSGKHGKVALCEHGSDREVAIKSELIKSPNNPFSRPYREYFILKQLSALANKPHYYENSDWIGFIQLLDWFKAKTDQIRITSAPASPVKTPTRLTGNRNAASPTTPVSGNNRTNQPSIGSKTAPRSITAVSRLNFSDENENVDAVGGSLQNLQLTPAGKRSRVSATPTPKRIVPRTPIMHAQATPLRQREIKLQEGNLVLEKADTTLYAIRHELSFEIYRDVLFQILYALYVGQTEFEFVHHDLHIQNVLLKRLKVPLQDYIIEKTDASGLVKYDSVDEERLADENCGVFKDGNTTWYSRGPWIVKLSDFGLSRIKMVDDDGRVIYDLTHPLAEAFLGDKDVLKILDEFARVKITRWLTRAECIECGAVVKSIKAECFVGAEMSISLEDAQSVLQSPEAIAAMESLVEQKQKSSRQIRAAIRKSALHLKSLLHHDFFASMQTRPTSLCMFGREGALSSPDRALLRSSSATLLAGQGHASAPEDDLDGLARSPSSSVLPSTTSLQDSTQQETLSRAGSRSDHATVTSLAATFRACSLDDAALDGPGPSALASTSSAYISNLSHGDDLQTSLTTSFDLDLDGFDELAPLALPIKKLTFDDAIIESPVKVGKRASESSKSRAGSRQLDGAKSRATSVNSNRDTLEIGNTDNDNDEIDVCSISPSHSPRSGEIDGEDGESIALAELTPARRSARVAARGSGRAITTPTKPGTSRAAATTPRRALVKPDPAAIAKASQSPVAEDSTKYANKAKTPTPIVHKPSSSTSSRKAPHSSRRNTILPSEFAALAPDHGVHSMNDCLATLSIEPSSAQLVTNVALNMLTAAQEAHAIVVYEPVPARWLGEPLILPMPYDNPTDCIEAVRDYLMRRAQHWEEHRHKRRPWSMKRFFLRTESEINEARILKLAQLRKKKPIRRSLGGLRSGARTGLEKAVNDSQRSRRKSMSSAATSDQTCSLASELSLDVTDRVLEVVSEALEAKDDDILADSDVLESPAYPAPADLNPQEMPKHRAFSNLEANGLGLLTSPTAPRRSARRRSSLVASPLSTPVPVFSLTSEAPAPSAPTPKLAMAKSTVTAKSAAPTLPTSPKRPASSTTKPVTVSRVAKPSSAPSVTSRPPTPVKLSTSKNTASTSSPAASSASSSSSPKKVTAKATSTRVMRV